MIGKIFIVDWEWSGPGDRLCDLATFCALSEQDCKGQKQILAKYLQKDQPSKLGKNHKPYGHGRGGGGLPKVHITT